VLWEPTAEPSKIPEFRHAIEVVPDLQEYAEVGLVGLKRLGLYRETYERLVGVLSRRIVDVAEGSTASRVVESSTDDEAGRTRFVVAVLAPRRGEIPRGRRADRYGIRPSDWRAFGSTQPMPAARHAAVRAPVHQLAQVLDYDEEAEQFADSPGVLLIDPWIVAAPDGQQRLTRVLGRLPIWAQAVVLADQNDPQYYERGQQLANDATDLCNLHRQRAGSRRDVRSVEAFDTLMPFWLQLAYRRFLHRNRRSVRSFERKPRLGGAPVDDEEE
jgi:FxsC-like protein